MSRYMLDTNMVSYIIKGTSLAARQRLNSISQGDTICISAITEAEIRFGLAKLKQSLPRIQAMERFLAHTQVLSWGQNEAAVYGISRARHEALGKPLNSIDMLIAAHAIAANAILVTRDKAFQHVQGLLGTENWATDL